MHAFNSCTQEAEPGGFLHLRSTEREFQVSQSYTEKLSLEKKKNPKNKNHIKWLCRFIGRTSILGLVMFVLIQVAQCVRDWEEGTLMLQSGVVLGTRDGIRLWAIFSRAERQTPKPLYWLFHFPSDSHILP